MTDKLLVSKQNILELSIHVRNRIAPSFSDIKVEQTNGTIVSTHLTGINWAAYRDT